MSGAVITLDEKLDLRAAAPLRAALLEQAGQPLELDASGVRHIGALAVQVLRSAARSWAEAGMPLTFAGASTDLADQLFLLGHSPESLVAWEEEQ